MAGTNNLTLKLKLLIDKEANKVVFAEAGKDFVDVLFGLLSMPVGSVISLLTNQSVVGSLGNLYKSIKGLDVSYMQQNQSTDFLLNPRAPTKVINGVTTFPGKLFSCESFDGYVSDKKDSLCPVCGSSMHYELKYVEGMSGSSSEGGYVKGLPTYMVTDDLSVTPLSVIYGMELANKSNPAKNLSDLEGKEVKFGIEGLQLLQASLRSETVLTDVFLKQ